MERKKADFDSVGVVGHRRCGLRAGLQLCAISDDALPAGGGRKRGLPGDAGATGELVSAIGTGASQWLLELMPTAGGRGIGAPHKLDDWPMGMEEDAHSRRGAPFSVAAH